MQSRDCCFSLTNTRQIKLEILKIWGTSWKDSYWLMPAFTHFLFYSFSDNYRIIFPKPYVLIF